MKDKKKKDIYIISVLLEFLEVSGLMGLYICKAFARIPKIDKREFIENLYEVACRSIPTVIITMFSIGMVFSLQLTKYFMAFGAVASIGGANAETQIRELAPLITTVVLIGRVGSAWASEMGSMKMTEQVSALKVMKIDLNDFLISPKVMTGVLSMPILTLVAIIASLWGGQLIAGELGEVSLGTFLDSVRMAINLRTFLICLFKSMVFGGLIASIACLYGLKAEGGALGVGRYTTKAVVASLICLFAMDYILSFIFYGIF